MKPSQQKIFREDWLNFHSYTNSASSDLYYIKLCNKVYNIIDASVANSENQTLIINDEDIKKLSCILTCYFEDIISGTGIWNIFININKEKTGKILPFYDCSDYYEDEINKNDLKFLCWHFFTRLYENFYCYSPEDKTMGMIADEVYNLFDGEFEDAPENEKSKKDLSFSPEYFDIMEFIPMLSWLGIRSFILADNNDVLDKEIDYLVEYLEENDMSDYASEYVTDHIVVFPINNVTSFYDLRTPEFMAKLLGEDNCSYKYLNNAGVAKTGYFSLKSKDHSFTTLTHIATGTDVSFETKHIKSRGLKLEDDKIYKMYICKFNDIYNIIGGIASYEYDEKLIESIKDIKTEAEFFNEPSEDQNNFVVADQDEIWKNIIEELDKDEDFTPEDKYWFAVQSLNLNKDYITQQIKDKKFADLRFPGENGEELFYNNLDFILPYILRQDKEGIY